MKSIRTLLFVVSLLLIPDPASAHTLLVDSNPEAGVTLEVSPTEVRLEFNEDLLLVGDENPNQVEVLDQSNALLSGKTLVDGPVAIVDLAPATGILTVRYRVVSADGHPVVGEYQFTVDAPRVISAPELSQPAPEDGPNLLIRLIWVLLVLSGIGSLALLRLRK